MARVASIFLFCFLALHLVSHCVIVADGIIKFSYTTRDTGKDFFTLRTPDNKDTDHCKFYHRGIGKPITVLTSKNEDKKELGRVWGISNDGSCWVEADGAATGYDYGRYEIEAYSSNGTLLTTDIINLYKKHEMGNSRAVNKYYGEIFTISLLPFDILGTCNYKMNKGLCPNDTSINESQLTCKLLRDNDYYAKIHLNIDDNTGIQNEIKKTGNCNFEIFLSVERDFYDSHVNWYIEAWYGYMILYRTFYVTGKYQKLKATVGSARTVRLNLPERRNITCLSFRPQDGNYSYEDRILQNHNKCEYVIKNINLRDNGTWMIEYKYNNDDFHRFQVPYQIYVIEANGIIEFSLKEAEGYSFSLKTLENKDIDYCQFHHYGVGGSTNFTTLENEESDEFKRMWKKGDDGSCLIASRKATIYDYGRYEIEAYSNGTLLTTDIINLYQQHDMEGNNAIKVKGYFGEFLTVSLERSEIEKVCNDEMNKGLCMTESFGKDSQPTCKIWRYDDTFKEIDNDNSDNTGMQNEVVKTGNCQFKIHLPDDGDSFYENRRTWHIEAWYGYLVIHRIFYIYGICPELLKAKVGFNQTIRLDREAWGQNITCLSFEPKDGNYSYEDRILKNHNKCEYVINNISPRDNGTWMIEYQDNNDDSPHRFKKPYKIVVDKPALIVPHEKTQQTQSAGKKWNAKKSLIFVILPVFFIQNYLY